jgi:flagellar M-ring protein FliF
LSAGSNPLLYQRKEETLNYEITQSQSKEVVAPGKISKVSLSVMVDSVTDQAQLTSIKSAVAAAAGIDTTRGDTMAVDTIAFDRTYYTKQETDLTQQSNTDLYYRIGMIALGVIAAILILWYIMRLFKNLRLASGDNWSLVLRPVSEAGLASGAMNPGLAAPSKPASLQGGPDLAGQLAATIEQAVAQQRPLPPSTHPEDEQMAKALTLLTDENPATVADIIQMWLSEDEKHHG